MNAKLMIFIKVIDEYLGDPTPSPRSTKLSDLPIPHSLESSNILDDSLEGFGNTH